MTYPNVMVLDYLRQTGQISPELQMQAEEYVAQGYQRLLTFQLEGGGFSLFGTEPADPMLSAYGLMQLADMSRVYPVEQRTIERTSNWLFSQQEADGSWTPGGGGREMAGLKALESKLSATAFVTWALAEAGYGNYSQTERGVDYLLEHLTEAKDPYALALCANALVAASPNQPGARWALDRLAAAAIVEEDAVHWQTAIQTFMGGSGQAGDLETTALAALALLRSGQRPDLAQGALTFLLRHKDSHGTWGTTQATVWTLKALLASVPQSGEAAATATVTVQVNGSAADPIVLDESNAGVLHQLVFDDVGPGENRVSFKVEGEGRLMAQVTAEYYLPWEQVPPEPPEQEALGIQVKYDRTLLAVDDTVTASVSVELNTPGMVRMALIDLGVPPGFNVQTEDLQALVSKGTIERFELAGRQIIIYLTDLVQDQPVQFQHRLRAKVPLRVTVPHSLAYDYYNPELAGEERPIRLTVEESES